MFPARTSFAVAVVLAAVALTMAVMAAGAPASPAAHKPCVPKPKMVCNNSGGRVNWSGKNLSGARITNGLFDSSKAIRTNFTGATLINASFSTAGSDFTGANFTRARLVKSSICCKMQNTKFVNATVDVNYLTGSNLINADFRGSKISSGFSDNNLTHATFVGAKVQGTLFEMCRIRAAGANFSGVKLPSSTIAENTDLSGANLSHAVFASSVNFATTNFTHANMSGISLKGAQNLVANFTGANLTNADLTGANLSSANLTNANLTGAKVDPGAIAHATTKNTTCQDGHVVTATGC